MGLSEQALTLSTWTVLAACFQEDFLGTLDRLGGIIPRRAVNPSSVRAFSILVFATGSFGLSSGVGFSESGLPDEDEATKKDVIPRGALSHFTTPHYIYYEKLLRGP